MGCLIIVSGVPGSGKSTWVKQNYKMGRVIDFSSDEIRKELTGSYTDFSKEKDKWHCMYTRAHIVLENFPNTDVVLDATYLSKNQRLKVVREFCEVADEICLVQFQISKELAKQQNSMRDRVVPEEVIDTMSEKFDPVDDEEARYYGSVIIMRDHGDMEVVKYGNCSRNIDCL